MLDKKLCRRFADPGLAFPSGHGLLHAPQVDYIVRTAVRIIGRHRVLVLYVYDREQAARGDFRPLWAMFHHSKDYITFARKDDGSATWSTASFERLGASYKFVEKCAFYSQNDETRVSQYLRSEDGGFAALCKAQRQVKEARAKARQRQRDRQIIQRMKPLKALPRGLKAWAHRTFMPAYLFYDTNRGKTASGTCSACGKPVTVPGAKHNAKTVCPHCHRELTLKSRGKRGYIHDHDTCQVMHRISESEVVIRIVKVQYD